MDDADRRTLVPRAERLLSREDVSAYAPLLSRPLVVKVVSSCLADIRRRTLEDEAFVPTEAAAAEACLAELARLDRKRLRPVLNGMGAVLHPAMGRSPLSPAVWEAARELNVGYSNFEYDLEEGGRRKRGGIVQDLLSVLTGAEAGVVVNNNAAAVMLSLVAVCAGKEVIVSRGDAVHIGGGFRVPEIVALASARIKEVGTVNVTTVEDYVRAVGPETAAVLVVRSADFALRGLARRPDLRALVKALPPGIPLIVDQGSGSVSEGVGAQEPVLRSLRAGARLVCFSGDKVLGGPQSGMAVGDAGLVARLARHPLMRVFRPGKTVLSLLEATLIERLGRGGESGAELSAVERAAVRGGEEASQELKAFGRRMLKRLPKDAAVLVPCRAALGAGSSPDELVDSWALELTASVDAEALKKELRAGQPPLVVRVEKGRALVDLFALEGEEAKLLAELIGEALSRAGFAPAGGSSGSGGA